MKDPTPPHSVEAEQAILGAVLLNNQSLSEVRSVVSEVDFYVGAHRKIFGGMLALAGKTIDHPSLGEVLIERGDLQLIGGPIALDALTKILVEGRAAVGSVTQYAETLRSLTARRQMIRAAERIADAGYSGSGEIVEYLATSRLEIAQAARHVQGAGPQKIDDELATLYRYLEEDAPPPGLVKTGIDVIDASAGGLWPGLLYTVAGRPSMGKSAFLLNIAVNVALAGQKVLFITLEDVRQFAAMRMIARLADINLSDIVQRRVNKPDQYRRIIDASGKLADRPLWFDDSPGLTSESIAQIASVHQTVHGLDLLIIDHLGEVADKGESETSIAGRAAMRFRDIAKEHNIPVLMASQLNRKVEDRDGNIPKLSDLRQSGRIEEASRVVWFLYRPAYYAKDAEGMDVKALHLIQAKASHGQTGVMRLRVDLSRMHVRSWSEYTDGAWPMREEKTDGK